MSKDWVEQAALPRLETDIGGRKEGVPWLVYSTEAVRDRMERRI